MMSARLAWPAAALLILALVPTVANVYLPAPPQDEGALARDLPAELPAQGPPAAGPHDADWSERQFGTRESVSRVYGDLKLFAARTRDAKKLFHFPELALSYGRAVTSTRTVRLECREPVPAQLLTFVTSQGTHVALYALLCGSDPVSNPYRHVIREFPACLMGDHKPWTLVYVQASTDSQGVPVMIRRLESLLSAACTELLD